MRKTLLLLTCLLLTAFSAACKPSPITHTEPESPLTPTETVAPDIANDEEAAETPAPAESPASAPTPAPAEEGPAMYSSYAHMVSFDPALGLAEFDFFDMLRGDEAVEWLVENEGYSVTDAAAAVADFADSEFVEKNVNPQLRAIDLTNIPITLMFDPDTGDMLEPGSPLNGSLSDLSSLFDRDQKLVLDAFFYWIEVSQGEVVAVTQVYWP